MKAPRKNSVEMANLIRATNNGTAAETSLSTEAIRSDPSTLINTPTEITDVNVRIVDPNMKPTRIKPKTSAATREASDSNGQPTRVSQVVDDEEEDEIVLKYGAEHVVKLFVPVTLCLLFVIISLSFVKSYQESGGATLVYTPFNEDSQSNGTKLWMSIANAFIFISVVIVMTIVLLVLYKFKCYRIIHGWLAFSSLMLLFFFTYMYIR